MDFTVYGQIIQSHSFILYRYAYSGPAAGVVPFLWFHFLGGEGGGGRDTGRCLPWSSPFSLPLPPTRTSILHVVVDIAQLSGNITVSTVCPSLVYAQGRVQDLTGEGMDFDLRLIVGLEFRYWCAQFQMFECRVHFELQRIGQPFSTVTVIFLRLCPSDVIYWQLSARSRQELRWPWLLSTTTTPVERHVKTTTLPLSNIFGQTGRVCELSSVGVAVILVNVLWITHWLT